MSITGSSGATRVTSFTGNILVSTGEKVALISADKGTFSGADGNSYFSPFLAKPFNYGTDLDLAGFQKATGGDATSTSAWFTQATGATPRTELFTNDTAASKSVPLTRSYVGLDQKPVAGPLELPAFSSRVLVAQ